MSRSINILLKLLQLSDYILELICVTSWYSQILHIASGGNRNLSCFPSLQPCSIFLNPIWVGLFYLPAFVEIVQSSFPQPVWLVHFSDLLLNTEMSFGAAYSFPTINLTQRLSSQQDFIFTKSIARYNIFQWFSRYLPTCRELQIWGFRMQSG